MLIPVCKVLGAIAFAADAVVYASEGDWVGTVFSLAGAASPLFSGLGSLGKAAGFVDDVDDYLRLGAD